MWKAIASFFAAVFRSASPQRADFESVTDMWRALAVELKAQVAALQDDMEELKEKYDKLHIAYHECELSRKDGEDRLKVLEQTLQRLEGQVVANSDILKGGDHLTDG